MTMSMDINSRKHGLVEFIRSSKFYIRVRFSDTDWLQICNKGKLTGGTIGYAGDNQDEFEKICRKWWRSFLKNEKQFGEKL